MSRGPLRVPQEGLAPGLLALSAEAAAYVGRVHRLAAGDRLVLFDPDRAVEADAELVEVGRREIRATVGELRPASSRPARFITLIQGIGKGDKMDAIVRDATELGATRIVAALCERSVARPDAARAARWRRVAVEAARQCGRGDAPEVGAPLGFEEALRSAAAAGAVGLCLDPTALTRVAAVLHGLSPGAPIALAVGPEGGLTASELAAAERHGFHRATLGGLILRTETVGAAVLGALLVGSPG